MQTEEKEGLKMGWGDISFVMNSRQQASLVHKSVREKAGWSGSTEDIICQPCNSLLHAQRIVNRLH